MCLCVQRHFANGADVVDTHHQRLFDSKNRKNSVSSSYQNLLPAPYSHWWPVLGSCPGSNWPDIIDGSGPKWLQLFVCWKFGRGLSALRHLNRLVTIVATLCWREIFWLCFWFVRTLVITHSATLILELASMRMNQAGWYPTNSSN